MKLNAGEVIVDPAKYRRRLERQIEANVWPDRYAYQLAEEKLHKLKELENRKAA